MSIGRNTGDCFARLCYFVVIINISCIAIRVLFVSFVFRVAYRSEVLYVSDIIFQAKQVGFAWGKYAPFCLNTAPFRA